MTTTTTTKPLTRQAVLNSLYQALEDGELEIVPGQIRRFGPELHAVAWRRKGSSLWHATVTKREAVKKLGLTVAVACETADSEKDFEDGYDALASALLAGAQRWGRGAVRELVY